MKRFLTLMTLACAAQLAAGPYAQTSWDDFYAQHNIQELNTQINDLEWLDEATATQALNKVPAVRGAIREFIDDHTDLESADYHKALATLVLYERHCSEIETGMNPADVAAQHRWVARRQELMVKLSEVFLAYMRKNKELPGSLTELEEVHTQLGQEVKQEQEVANQLAAAMSEIVSQDENMKIINPHQHDKKEIALTTARLCCTTYGAYKLGMPVVRTTTRFVRNHPYLSVVLAGGAWGLKKAYAHGYVQSAYERAKDWWYADKE